MSRRKIIRAERKDTIAPRKRLRKLREDSATLPTSANVEATVVKPTTLDLDLTVYGQPIGFRSDPDTGFYASPRNRWPDHVPPLAHVANGLYTANDEYDYTNNRAVRIVTFTEECESAHLLLPRSIRVVGLRTLNPIISASPFVPLNEPVIPSTVETSITSTEFTEALFVLAVGVGQYIHDTRDRDRNNTAMQNTIFTLPQQRRMGVLSTYFTHVFSSVLGDQNRHVSSVEALLVADTYEVQVVFDYMRRPCRFNYSRRTIEEIQLCI